MANDELPEGPHKTLALHAPNALQVDRIWRTYWLPLFTSDAATKLNLEILKGSRMKDSDPGATEEERGLIDEALGPGVVI